MLSKKLGLLGLTMGLLLGCASAARGQTTFGAVVGSVVDSSGAAVPEGKVTLTNLGTNEKRLMTTGVDGLYSFVNLLPGRYRLEVDKGGFSHFLREPIVVEVQNTVRIDVTLQLGAVTQTIEVTAQSPLLQPETSDLGQVIEQRQVNELPLNGRNAMNLVALAPSVVPQGQAMQNPSLANNYGWSNYQIGGAITNQASEYLDGVPLNIAYINGMSMIPSQDAIQEFKVQTNNLSAEWGRFAGGVVNFTTKSGTNQIHGTAYEFLRNKVLNSNNFFNNAVTPAIPTPAFTQNQFGLNAGGPLVLPHLYDGHDKTFWFASYEGFRVREGFPFLLTEPTPAELNGDLRGLVDSSGNMIPVYNPTTTVLNPDGSYSRQQISCSGVLNVICPQNINPTSAVLTKIFPKPNTPGTATGLFNYATNASSGGDNDQLIIRGDQNVSSRQRIFARYSYWYDRTLPLDPLHNGEAFVGTETFRTHNAILDDVYTFSPTTILDLAATFNRMAYNRIPLTQGYNLAQLGPNWAPLQSQVFTPTIPGLCFQPPFSDIWCSGGNGSIIIDRNTDLRAVGSLTKMAGRHTMKVGGEFRQDTVNSAHTDEPVGLFFFTNGFTASDPILQNGGSSLASFLLGYGAPPSFGGAVSQSKPLLPAELMLYPAVYAQDTYRVTRKLTLNYGIRWEQTGPFSERHNRISVLLPNTPSPLPSLPCVPLSAGAAAVLGSDQLCLGKLNGDLGLVGTPARPSRNATDKPWHQFSPRLGFAYQLTPKTVLRGGYGLFWISNTVGYTSESDLDFINSISTPWITSGDGGVSPCVNPSASVGVPACPGGATFNLSNPFPNGILNPPGRDPSYQGLAYGQYFFASVPNNPYAYYQQWNLDLQRELPGGFFLDVAYAGTKGTHLPDLAQPLNIMPDKYLALGFDLFDTVPNPFYGLVNNGSALSLPFTYLEELLVPHPQYGAGGMFSADSGLGSSIYHSLQLKVEKHLKGGGTLLAAYTNSKMITTADVDSLTNWLDATAAAGIQNWNNLKAERSIASYDVPQRLVVSYVLDLPVGRGKKFLSGVSGPADKVVSGWGVQGVTTYQRGFPLNFGSVIGALTSFGNGQRPDKSAAGALPGSADSRLNEWFNTSAFSAPSPFVYGNESRTDPVLRSQGINNWDFALIKNTSFGPGERVGLQFRTEVFNLFNTPQFGPPSTTFGAANFGQVSAQINNPRLIQFALRFLF